MGALRNDIDWVEWMEKYNLAVDMKKNMNISVMDFLVILGYEEAAEKFRLESGVEPHVSTATMTGRAAIKKAILDGNMEYAIQEVKDKYPEVLVKNPQLHFYLQRQQFIELIRKGDFGNAKKLAREKLIPEAEKDQRLSGELMSTIAVLIIEDFTSCLVSKLFDMSERVKTASQVNAAILLTQIDKIDARLSTLLKRLILVQI